MRKRLAIRTAIAVLLLAVPPVHAEEAAVKAALGAAKTWLALLDAGDYGASWRQAAALFKRQLTAEQWETAARNARASLPGAPDGEYVVIQYATGFESKKAAIETVTPMKDPDRVWRVAGYYVK
jgi:Protein of unknown function (DUF4019)